jgi:glycosyltransferase involved in cell wall biosynthesis
MPEVTVIMNCYNGEAYLREAIDSVYAQDFQDWEIIFWDNASTDGSAAIAQSYDSRVRYFRGETNVPLGGARKLAMAQAKGTWVGFLDTDDLWYRDKLSRQLAAVEGTEHVLCYAGIDDITPDGQRIRQTIPLHDSGDMLERQLLQFDINMVTPILRRAALERYGITFDENVWASEEYNLFIRLLAHGTGCAIPSVLGAWRISSGSLTDRQIARHHVERRYTLDQLLAENPGIETRIAGALREAYARGDYYEARYLMTTGRRGRAVALLAKNARIDARYGALAFAALLPGAWRLAHSKEMKRRVLPRLFGTARYNQ